MGEIEGVLNESRGISLASESATGVWTGCEGKARPPREYR